MDQQAEKIHQLSVELHAATKRCAKLEASNASLARKNGELAERLLDAEQEVERMRDTLADDPGECACDCHDDVDAGYVLKCPAGSL